jgi:hypothetical protein
MKRILSSLAVCLVVLTLASAALAKDKKSKPGPLTGTWECTSHGGPQGDMPFTLHLDQNKQTVSGSVESPMGGAEISSATFKNKNLDIQINAGEANYHLTAKLKKNQLDGEWSGGQNEKGTWEGKKSAPTKP